MYKTSAVVESPKRCCVCAETSAWNGSVWNCEPTLAPNAVGPSFCGLNVRQVTCASSRMHRCLKWQRNRIKSSNGENDFPSTATNAPLANFQRLSLKTAPDLRLEMKRVEATLLDYQPPVSHNCSRSETTKTNQIRPNVSACQRCPLRAKSLLLEKCLLEKQPSAWRTGPSLSLIFPEISSLSLSVCRDNLLLHSSSSLCLFFPFTLQLSW